MSQEHLADATGLSIVHINRTLRVLTEEGAITHKGREIQIHDWERLQIIGGFDPTYLHMAA